MVVIPMVASGPSGVGGTGAPAAPLCNYVCSAWTRGTWPQPQTGLRHPWAAANKGSEAGQETA